MNEGGAAGRTATPVKGKPAPAAKAKVEESVEEEPPKVELKEEEPKVDVKDEQEVQETNKDESMEVTTGEEAKVDANGSHVAEEEDEEEETAEGDKTALDEEDAKEEEKSLIVKLKGFPKMTLYGMHLMLHDLFTNELKIALPKVKLPKGKEKWIYAECVTLEDKKKILETLNATYKYKDQHPLQATSGWVASEYKATEVLDKETALDLLFRHRKLPYREQLNIKSEETEKMMDEIFKNLKKINPKFSKIINKYPEIGKIVPLVPTYGYSLDSSFAIEIDPETKEVVVGLRACSKNAERIIPIDECPSVPKTMAEAVKDFVSHLSEYGLEPFNRETESGNILGVQCKMSTACEIILSVLVPKENTFLKEFVNIKSPEEVNKLKEEAKQREEAKKAAEEAKKAEANKAAEEVKKEPETTEKKEGEEEEEVKKEEAPKPTGEKADESVQLIELEDEDVKATDEEKAKYGRQLKEIKPGLIRYFQERGKALGIVSIFSNWILYNRRGAWANRQHFYHHICGATSVKEQTLNLHYDLWPYKQWSPRTSIFGTIINTIDSLVHLDKSTSVAVASEYRLVALYYAKRCKDVISIHFWSMKKSNMHNRGGFSWWIQKQGVRNMEFVATKASALSTLDRTNFARSQAPKVAIIWGFTKVALLRKLTSLGVKRIVTVFNINRNVQNIQADIQKYFEAIAPNIAATKIIPVDIQPHGNQYTLVCYLEEVMGMAGGQVGMKRKGPVEMLHGNAKRKRLPSLLMHEGPKKAWETARPPPMVQNTMDPINSTINQLTGFMQNQILFNEMVKAGIQEIFPQRDQSRPMSPPRFGGRGSGGGSGSGNWVGRGGRDGGDRFDDYPQRSDNFNGRDQSPNRWNNKGDDGNFSRNRNPSKPMKDNVWGNQGNSSGSYGNKQNWLNSGMEKQGFNKQQNFNRNDSRGDYNYDRRDNRRSRGPNSSGNWM
ncbi:uncharacterized protein LOC106664535 isoform X2 [Cimex lectularius]|uniref:Uncharacterized protein n=1 Tax=Cimex lectularius TaxID=79782 RepID=A0A8I6RGG8_CIMLE|nr:uncharacterized protein LOC106664535 isoform X2 [Cimex lectularius]